MTSQAVYMKASEIENSLRSIGDRKTAQVLQRFFKTAPGEYGAGDVFVGIHVPKLRQLAREYQECSLAETARLLRSPVHEARLLALFLLVRAYKRGSVTLQERIFKLYLRNTRRVNNWDLVDASAEQIVGAHLSQRPRALLGNLAASQLLWDRRIAVIATFQFIKQGEFEETLRIAGLLLRDPADLIHKAVGWMLREIGKRDRLVEETFLQAHYRSMPRTMLRYAIEKFPEKLRQRYLRGML